MDIAELVLRDGDLVRATGRVVVDGDEVWFEPPLPMLLVYSSDPPAWRPSGLGVRTVGVDLEALDEGWASLSGVWQDDRLVVREQSSPDLRSDPGSDFGREKVPRWDRPPCPPPPGGWPYGELDENIDVPPELLSAYPITSLALFRPSPRQCVLVVAAEEPERVDAHLRPRYGDRLCVVRSRWTRRQIEDLLHQLREGMSRWMIYECGETVTEEGQPLVTADVSRVLPAFASFVRAVPDGLLSLNPWLAPRTARG